MTYLLKCVQNQDKSNSICSTIDLLKLLIILAGGHSMLPLSQDLCTICDVVLQLYFAHTLNSEIQYSKSLLFSPMQQML